MENKELIRRAREIDASATPGPWVCDNKANSDAVINEDWGFLRRRDGSPAKDQHGDQDIDFVLAARTLLPALATALEQADASHDTLARVVGRALVVPTLSNGESLAGQGQDEHVIVACVLRMKERAEAAERELARIKETALPDSACELAALVDVWNANRDEERASQTQCAKCKETGYVPTDLEPSPLCNLCAQEAVDILLDAVRVLTAQQAEDREQHSEYLRRIGKILSRHPNDAALLVGELAQVRMQDIDVLVEGIAIYRKTQPAGKMPGSL